MTQTIPEAPVLEVKTKDFGRFIESFKSQF